MPFKGDDVGETPRKRLSSAVSRVYYAAEIRIVYRTNRIPTPPIEQALPLFTKSHLIYQFKCSCGASYLGRTERRLGVRVAEHVPVWVQNYLRQPSGQTQRSPASSIAGHLLETGHRIDLVKDFRLVLTTSKSALLGFAEAIAIHKWSPQLCV